MKKVLSIDDSKSVHAFIEGSCKSLDISLHHAYDGEEGLSKILNGEVWDLVLLDWEMPKLTGLEVLKKARDSGYTSPIYIVTTKNSVEDIELSLSLGANDYIMKPFTEDILVEKISKIFE